MTIYTCTIYTTCLDCRSVAATSRLALTNMIIGMSTASAMHVTSACQAGKQIGANTLTADCNLTPSRNTQCGW